jgi:hypothetical protein
MLIARSQQLLGQRVAVTEAFTKAVEQLADDRVALRLGGIYSLDRVADDDPSEQSRIAEILATFVRGNLLVEGEIPRDAMAALSVLTRREWPDGIDLVQLSLSGVRLPGAVLISANLAGIDLSESVLRGAKMCGADLNGADLRKADLSGCDLRDTNLSNVRLSAALADSTTRWPIGFTPAEHGVRSA